MIYFDNASTSKPYKEVLDTYVSLCSELVGNPSSANGLGTKASNYISKARAQIEKTLNLKNDEYNIVFTSGATESNNEAILGYARRHSKEGKHLITTSGEHASVLSVFKELEKEGFDVTYLSLDNDGFINLEELKESLKKEGTILVSIMAVNNEVGNIYPLHEISSYVHSLSKAVFMSDVTQGIGKTKIDFNDLDIFSMSGHKVGGLKSSGILAYRKNINIDPLLYGGEQENGMRSGTLNAPLICSLATALRLYMSSMDSRINKAQALNSFLREKILLLSSKEAFINSPNVNCSPFILNFGLYHYKASVISEALSKDDIYVTTQSACSSHSKSGSHVLEAMNKGDFISSNSIRLSFSGEESLKDGEDFMLALTKLMNSIKRI